jgi:hypothetical protein
MVGVDGALDVAVGARIMVRFAGANPTSDERGEVVHPMEMAVMMINRPARNNAPRITHLLKS